MCFYTVEVFANMPLNKGERDYSQCYIAVNSEGTIIAYEYESNNKLGNEFIYHVYSKNFIKSNTGSGAIHKFKKWRAEGLNDNFLETEN